MTTTLKTGTRIRTDVAAYRRGYPAQITAELTALQRQYAPPTMPSSGDPSAVRKMGGVAALSLVGVLALAGLRIAQSVRRSRLRNGRRGGLAAEEKSAWRGPLPAGQWCTDLSRTSHGLRRRSV